MPGIRTAMVGIQKETSSSSSNKEEPADVSEPGGPPAAGLVERSGAQRRLLDGVFAWKLGVAPRRAAW
jgi:hypothetical protein